MGHSTTDIIYTEMTIT